MTHLTRTYSNAVIRKYKARGLALRKTNSLRGLQAARASRSHVMAARRVGASPPRRAQSAFRHGIEAVQGVSTLSKARVTRCQHDSLRRGIGHARQPQDGHAAGWAKSRADTGHARKSRADRLLRRKLAPVTRAERSPSSLAHLAGEAPPRLSPRRKGATCVAWINHKTKFVIFVRCDIHGRVRRVRHRVYSIVPVHSSASKDVIGGNGLGVAASQTVQLTRGFTCT